jgi:hypothetical protein
VSEPSRWARTIEPVISGIFRWSVEDDRLVGLESDAHAVVVEGRVTLLDPLPVDPAALAALGAPEAIVLTAGNHQRASWRLRRELGIPVFAPQDAHALEEHADGYYLAGEPLPGGLVPFHTPGPIESMHVLWRPAPVSVVFLADLLTHDGRGNLAFVASAYQDEPERTRHSVRRVLEQLAPEVVCFSHGPPLKEGVPEALLRALREDPERASLMTSAPGSPL